MNNPLSLVVVCLSTILLTSLPAAAPAKPPKAPIKLPAKRPVAAAKARPAIATNPLAPPPKASSEVQS